MTMTPRLELRQTQALVMTPRLQQALRMLRMSNAELAEHVAGIVEGNPLLALARPVPREGGAPARSGLRGAPGAADGASAVDLAAGTVTLREHLTGQIPLARADGRTAAAALLLVDELDGDGYLRGDPAEIAARHGLGEAAFGRALELLQGCDPAGVGARDLAECLRLQLADRGELDAAMARLLGGLGLLAEGRRAELALSCGVGDEALGGLLRRLRRLDPRPGARFADEVVQVVVPDVFVRRTETGWDVEVNTETLPRVLVDNVYSARLSTASAEAQAFVSECRAEAGWLVRSIEQRARTILAVATAIVAHQEHFLARGVAGLRPLSQRGLAERLGLHESTISRVTANKYLACDRGTFPMRFFFSQPIGTTAGDAVSAAAVQERIRAMIRGERPPRILSDDRIVTVLQGEGIDIARRTVAKYRDGMGIPSSFERRRLKAAAGPA